MHSPPCSSQGCSLNMHKVKKERSGLESLQHQPRGMMPQMMCVSTGLWGWRCGEGCGWQGVMLLLSFGLAAGTRVILVPMCLPSKAVLQECQPQQQHYQQLRAQQQQQPELWWWQQRQQHMQQEQF